MKRKKILLIHDDLAEIQLIENMLGRIGSDISLHVSKNGEEALNVLMGSGTGTPENFIKPHLVILNKNLEDMLAFEFLEIIRKYYSLEDVRVMLLSGAVVNEMSFDKVSVAGFLKRPLDSADNFELLRSELNKGQAQTSLLPVAGIKNKLSAAIRILKGKALILNYTGIKVAACVTTMGIISGAAVYHKNGHTVRPPAAYPKRAPAAAHARPAKTEKAVEPAVFPLRRSLAKVKSVNTASIAQPPQVTEADSTAVLQEEGIAGRSTVTPVIRAVAEADSTAVLQEEGIAGRSTVTPVIRAVAEADSSAK